MKHFTSFIFFLFGCFALSGQNSTNPTIAVCNGQQFVCARSQFVELCVSIIVNPNYPYANSISGYRIDWGDGSPETNLPGGLNPPNQTHVYDVDDFLATCTDALRFTIILYTEHSDPAIEDANSAFVLTIRNLPKPGFTAMPNPICLGQTVTLETNRCPEAGLTYLHWNLGGGVTGSGDIFNHTYDTAGLKVVQHCVGNVCDTICVSQVVQVFNRSEAGLAADSGVVQLGVSPYKVCFGGDTAFVRLNALTSVYATQYQWSVSPSSGWTWIPPGSTPFGPLAEIGFTAPGIYTMTLKTNNQCGLEDDASIIFEVLDAPPLSLDPFPDNCLPVAYTPNPVIPNTIYTINGNPVSSFPVTLDLSADPYIVRAVLADECTAQVASDTFFIRTPPEMEITSPMADTIVCVGADPILLTTAVPGLWSGDGGNIEVVGGQTLFQTAVAGVYNLVASVGTGICRRADSLRLTVEEPYPLVLDTPSDACLSTVFIPLPFDSSAVYTINGVAQATFPVILDNTGSPYTISASAANACGPVNRSTTLRVIEPVDVSVLSPLDTVLCSEGALIPLIASDTIGQWSGGGIVQTADGPAFDPIAPGDFLLVFTRGFDVCLRADTVRIRVEPGNSVSLGPDQFLCNTQATATLMGNQGGGVYAGFALSGNTIDLSLLQLDTPYLYTLTIPTLPAACNAAVAAVTVSAPPDPAFQLDRDTACVDAAVTVVTPAAPGVQYTFNWGDGSSGNDPAHTYTAPGLYPISVQAQLLGPAACAAEASGSVYVLQPIQTANIQFERTPAEGCGPLLVSFVNNSIAENATYLWSFGDGQTFTGANPGAIVFEQGTEDTTYTVRLIVDNGCDTVEVSQSVTVFPKPRAAIGLSYQQPCSGGVLETSVRSTGNPANNTFYTSTGIVLPGDPSSSAFFTFFTDTIPDTVGIWLVSANDCGVDTAYQEVVVNPANVVALIGLPDTTKVCAGSPMPAFNFSTPGAPIVWSVSNGNSYIGDSIAVLFEEAGAYALTLYAYGCGYDSAVVPIFVRPAPELSVAYDPTRCPGDPVSFSALSNAADYLLRFGDGDSTFLKTAQHVYSSPGVYTAEARVISTARCTTTWSGQIAVLNPPEASLVADDSLCVGATAAFNGLSSPTGSTCTWQFGDGNIATGCEVTHTYLSPGLFTARMIAISPEGCRDTAFAPVYVRIKPEALILLDYLNLCSPAMVGFNTPVQGTTSVLWTTGDGAVSTQLAFTHTYAASGTYTVTLLASNEGICNDSSRQSLTIYQTPALDLETETSCTVDSGAVLRISTAVDNWSGLSGAGGYNRAGTLHTGLQPGTYTALVRATNGCERDTTIDILPINELLLSVPFDTAFIRLGESVLLEAQVNQTNVDFMWSPLTDLSAPQSAITNAMPFRTVSYVVTGTDAKGCIKRDTVLVLVLVDRETGFFIPNAFSPNEDGINDIFYPRNSNPAAVALEGFQVFDKYGELVFDIRNLTDDPVFENPALGWNGMFRSQKAEMGTYRYVIDIRYIDEVRKTFTGAVQLIR